MTMAFDCSSMKLGKPTSRSVRLLMMSCRPAEHASYISSGRADDNVFDSCRAAPSYHKTLLNPFHELNAPIISKAFDAKIRMSAKKHL